MSDKLTEMLKNKLERINPDAAALVEESLAEYLKPTDMLLEHINTVEMIRQLCRKYGVVAGIAMETPIEIHGTQEQLEQIWEELSEQDVDASLGDGILDISVL